MTKTITVNVTQKDIDEGKERSCERCPVALAVNRALDTDTNECSVSGYAVHLDGPTSTGFAQLPDEAVKFIERFDCRRLVTPFTFNITFQDYTKA